jgi:hypothetical protein
MERYVFRPLGEFGLFGSAIFLALFTGMRAAVPDMPQASAVDRQPPTLNLSAAGGFQQAVHFSYDQDRRELYRSPSVVAPLHALIVSPLDWVRIYTNSPLGLPRSASARLYMSARPEPCFVNVMIGCVHVEIEKSTYSIPLHPEADNFGFVAPSAPGSYWIALQADWGFGGKTQVFAIEVRA